MVVPAGSETAFGEGVVTANAGRFSLRTSSDQTYLGAPVVADDGRIAGVVVELSPNGDSQVAPVGAACPADPVLLSRRPPLEGVSSADERTAGSLRWGAGCG